MNTIRRCKPLLGTYVVISISSEDDNDTLLDMSVEAYSQIERVQKLMSFHDPASELSFLNKFAHKKPCAISPETEAVMQQALLLSELSSGLYDITIAPELVNCGALPDNHHKVSKNNTWRDIDLGNGFVSFNKKLLIDLGGIAKGYAVDYALSVIPDSAIVTINAGGDLRMSNWQNQHVEIRVPAKNDGETVSLPMTNTAIATSANYFLENNDSVIICPQTKQPVADQKSYSVFASSCMIADALTKVAYLDPDNVDLINSLGADAVIVDPYANVTFL